MACSAARLRAAAYRSAGERSSVIVLSSVPGATDNRTIIIRIGTPQTRDPRSSRPRSGSGRVRPVGAPAAYR
ncbi:hypothetical protein GCM10022295_39320 [Streptomyces osmaniensis]|uniref:Uncharacterized protein n=1 Tax=Streptomyces osmaniensis TaxID=593134 RepID=A0ABP6WNF4_9ACTN